MHNFIGNINIYIYQACKPSCPLIKSESNMQFIILQLNQIGHTQQLFTGKGRQYLRAKIKKNRITTDRHKSIEYGPTSYCVNLRKSSITRN